MAQTVHEVSATNSIKILTYKMTFILNVLIRKGKERDFHHVDFIGRKIMRLKEIKETYFPFYKSLFFGRRWMLFML